MFLFVVFVFFVLFCVHNKHDDLFGEWISNLFWGNGCPLYFWGERIASHTNAITEH